MKKSQTLDPKFAKWKGVDRSTIKWNPNIDESKCAGCSMSITFCGRNTFDFNKEKNRSVVARPNNCMVGCTSCET